MNQTGSSFGLLKVIGKVLLIPGKVGVYWLCKCKCGRLKAVRTNNLTGGNVRSCGRCGKVKHGLLRTSTYHSWQSMKKRCFNKDDIAYKQYGISRGCLEARLKKYPPEIALTLPLNKTRPRKE